MTATLVGGAALSLTTGLAAAEGFTDTPFLEDVPYRVHDPERPQPAVVDPGPAGAAALAVPP